jgi:hypothetical protein
MHKVLVGELRCGKHLGAAEVPSQRGAYFLPMHTPTSVFS